MRHRNKIAKNCLVEGVGFLGACSNFAHIAKFRSCLEVAEWWDFRVPHSKFRVVARFRMGLPLVFPLGYSAPPQRDELPAG